MAGDRVLPRDEGAEGLAWAGSAFGIGGSAKVVNSFYGNGGWEIVVDASLERKDVVGEVERFLKDEGKSCLEGALSCGVDPVFFGAELLVFSGGEELL